MDQAYLQAIKVAAVLLRRVLSFGNGKLFTSIKRATASRGPLTRLTG